MTLALATASLVPAFARAASQTWSATPTDALWTTAANWTGNAVPGTLNAASTDLATFNTPIANVGGVNIGDASNPITIDATRTIAGILFDTANVGSYQIGSASGSPLTLYTNQGNSSIRMSAAVTSSQVIANPLIFRQPSSTNGRYTFLNDSTTSTASLTLSGTITNAGTRPVVTVLDGANTGANTISGVISYTGSSQTAPYLVKRGTGTWALTAANTFTGTLMNDVSGNAGIQVLDGVLSVQNNNALGSSATANQLQVWIGKKSLTYTSNGTTTQTLSSVTGGTLELSNNITLDNGLSLNLFQDGTIRSNGSNATNGRINVNAAATSATIATVNATDVFTIGNSANDVTGGSASTVLNVAGPGTVLLNSANNYNGVWSFNSGLTQLGTGATLGSASAGVTFGENSTGKLQLNGNNATIGSLNSHANPGSAVIENGGAATGVNTLTVNTTAANTYHGVIQDGAAGSIALVKSGPAGTLALTRANTYTGGTAINGGALLANNSSGSATGTGSVAIATGGVLGGSGTVAGPVTANANGRIAPGAAAGQVGTLTVGSLTLNADSVLDYDVTDASTLDKIIVSTADGLTINGGQLNINGGTSPFTANGVYNLIGYTGNIGGIGTGAMTVASANQDIVNKSYTIGSAGGFVTLTVANSSTVISYWNADSDGNWSTGPWTTPTPNSAGAFASFGGGGTAITGNRTVTVDGAYTAGTVAFNNPSHSYTLAAGSGANITLDNNASTSFLTNSAGNHSVQVPLTLTTNGVLVNVAQAGNTLSVSGAVSGNGAVTKSGIGTLALTGANTYTGGTRLNGGTIQINNASSLGDAAGNLVFGGGNLQLLADVTTARNYQLNGTDNAVINTNGFNLTHSGTITPLNGGTGGLIKNGAGALVLSGVNTYTGSTTATGGTLTINSNASLGDVATGAALNLSGGTILESTATTSLSNAGANRAVNLGAGGATFNVADATTLTVPGQLTGSSALAKTGTGTLLLSGANSPSFNGPVTISAGTIQLGGGQANGQAAIGDHSTFANAITLAGGTLEMNGHTGSNSGGYGILNSWIDVPANQTGTLRVTQRGSFGGALSGSGTLNLVVNYVRGDINPLGGWNGFTGQINVSPAVAGGDFRLTGPLNLANAKLHLASGVAMAQHFNPPAGGETVQVLGELTGDAGALIGGQPVADRFVNWHIGANTTNNATYAGVIGNAAAQVTGPARVTKVGTNTQTLTGTNLYTGATTLNAGTLSVSANENLGFVGDGTTAAAPVVFNGGTLQVTGSALANLDGRAVNWSSFNGGIDVADAGHTFTVASGIGG
ncbi:MAG TPA: autotransporter-associated beta strand repeat-containing protein, partial [Tepidisphaeraceae bacterium]|nr:autotransporter-associated beta strand repeat-containing protein [Tepidisphaeraceae bacterium]